MGCAVGGAVLELARSFDNVLGIDYSHAFVNAARVRGLPSFDIDWHGDEIMGDPWMCPGEGRSHKSNKSNMSMMTCSILTHCMTSPHFQDMKDLGSRDYSAVVEGDISKRYTATVPQDIDRSRARFMQVWNNVDTHHSHL